MTVYPKYDYILYKKFFYSDYLFVFIVGILIFFTILIIYNRKYFFELTFGFFKKNFIKRFIYYKDLIKERFILYIIQPYFLVISAWLMTELHFIKGLDFNLKTFANIYLIVLLVFLIKYLAYKIMSYILNNNFFTFVLNSKVLLLANNSFVLVFLFFLISFVRIHFREYFFYFSLFYFFITYFLYIYYVFLLLKEKKVDYLINFYYFCIIEIMPLLYLFKGIIK